MSAWSVSSEDVQVLVFVDNELPNDCEMWTSNSVNGQAEQYSNEGNTENSGITLFCNNKMTYLTLLNGRKDPLGVLQELSVRPDR